jgi:hypothetical protein
MWPIVAAPTGVAKNDRLSMGAGARRFFERAKGRKSIDGRWIAPNNSIELHIRRGRRISYSSALEPSAAATGLPFSVGLAAAHRARSSRVPAATKSIGRRQKAPATNQRSPRCCFIDKFRNWSIQFPGMTSQATRLVRGKETCAGRIVAEGKGAPSGRAFRTTSDAS